MYLNNNPKYLATSFSRCWAQNEGLANFFPGAGIFGSPFELFESIIEGPLYDELTERKSLI